MIIVSGALVGEPNTLSDLLQASLAHVTRSRAEPGCIHHSVQIDAENPLRLVFFEKWEDMDALKTHFAQPGSATFIAAVRALAARQEKLEIFTANRVER